MNVNGGSPEGRESFASHLPSEKMGSSLVGDRVVQIRNGHFPRSASIAAACVIFSLFLAGCGSQGDRNAKATSQAPQATATVQAPESTPTPGYKLVLPGIQKSNETPTEAPKLIVPSPTATEAAPATTTPPESTATPESFFKKGIVYAGTLTSEASNKPAGAFILYHAPLSGQQIIFFNGNRQCAGWKITMGKTFTANKQAIQGNTLNQKIEGQGNLSLQESAEKEELTGTLTLDANPNIGPGCPAEKFTVFAQQKGNGLETLVKAYIEAINTFAGEQGGSLRPDILPQKILDLLARTCTGCNVANDLQIDKK